MQTDRDFEVTIADDGSTSEHVAIILNSYAARKLKAVHVWHPDVGFTLCQIRNRGVEASRGDYIIFLDGDCVPEVDFIAKHKMLAEKGTFVNGSRVMLSSHLTGEAIAGSTQICGRSPWYWIAQRFLRRASKLTGLVRLPDGSFRIKRIFSLKGIRGCNLAFWKSDFLQVDGFDESFVGWGHDDADFVLRLNHSGVARKNGFCATEVFHLWHKEAARDQESQNAKRVMERSKTTITQPTLGFSRERVNDDVVITRLG